MKSAKNLPHNRTRLIIALALLATPVAAHAEHTRVTNPNALGFEIFGRALQYGFQFDRVISDDLAAGVGFGFTPTERADGTDANQKATLFPVYVNYYFTRDAGSLLATAGATLVSDHGEVSGLKSALGSLEFPSNAILPTVGLGYENRGDTGFLFRVNAYAIAGKSIVPWLGFGFGYAF
jgi:hypothetical protein